MKLDSEFYRLPLRFDVERIIEEISRFPEEEWAEHPQHYKGNTALLLVTADGERNDDYVGHMKPTHILKKCPYLSQTLAAFNTVIGRSRLMRLEPSYDVPPHFDLHYSWTKRTRIHIPIITDPAVIFTCNNRSIHMAPGEAWIFDNWMEHNVKNGSDITRIHLVIDTTGTSAFWDLVKRAWLPDTPIADWEKTIEHITYDSDKTPVIKCEQYNTTAVFSPGEIQHMASTFKSDLPEQTRTAPTRDNIHVALDKFYQDWQSQWSLHRDTKAGFPHYQLLIRTLNAVIDRSLDGIHLLSNNAPAGKTIQLWLTSALDINELNNPLNQAGSLEPQFQVDTTQFDCPIFIVSAPRSGSTMLFEILQNNLALWTVGDETHAEIESIRTLNPAHNNYQSNRLFAEDASNDVAKILVNTFIRKLRNAEGKLFTDFSDDTKPSNFRFLEKTPKNSLRIPFIRKIFPNALFIFLHREPKANISSIMEAWKSGRFVTYPQLPDWNNMPWSLLLPHGWRKFSGQPLEEISAYQWKYTNDTIMDDLQDMPDSQWCSVSYEDLISNKTDVIQRLCAFADIPFGPRMQQLCQVTQPLSKYTLTEPAKDKWHQNKTEIEKIMPSVKNTIERLQALN